jgi:Putative glycosyl/glycerophosphate transferases involved in teichoic acid biosynthesis TagF/TagB/EpsJ/RodC
MIREWTISLYLFVFRFLFLFFKCFPQKNRIVFVVSFSENSRLIADEFRRVHVAVEFVFLCRGECIHDFRNDHDVTLPFETLNLNEMVRSAYYLATAKLVFVDNYYGFLSVVRFRHGVQCIQIWHAAGALKTFGLEDKSIVRRSKGARRRFQKVYGKFDKVVTGSEIMSDIFKRSFGLSDDRILRTGFPRTDIFFHRHDDATGRSRAGELPIGKKRILYAPTFRESAGHKFPLDLDLMKEALGSDYVLLLRLHPAEASRFAIPEKYRSFIFDCTGDPEIIGLMQISDLLITDYSSIPIEYSLLGKPMIFSPMI